MISRSPVVYFKEGVDILARKIFLNEGVSPYIATIRGIPGAGKSYFGREVISRLGFHKDGMLIKPHKLEYLVSQDEDKDYLLLEIDEYDNGYEELIKIRTRSIYHKDPDYQVLIVKSLAPLLDPELNLSRILEFFDLVVENSFEDLY